MIISVFIWWRLFLFFLTFLGSKVFELQANGGIGAVGNGKSFDFFASWAQWDGGHFYNIAKHGYFATSEFAFFPFYPISVKFLSFLFYGNLFVAGLVISNLAFLLFLYVFYQLIKEKFSPSVAKTSVFSVLAFPSAYFAVAYYSESLFMLFIACTFLLIEKKKFLTAGLFVTLSSITRSLGIFLLVPLAFSYLRSIEFDLRRLSVKAFSILIGFLGIGLYCFYLYFKFNDPFYFFTVESWWHRSLTNPLSTFVSYFNDFFRRPFNDYLDLGLTLSFLLILVLGFKKISFMWWLFALVVIIVPASTGTLTSMPRYLLSAIPVFVIIGQFLAGRTFIRVAVWSLGLLLQAILAIMFVNGYWTA